MKRIEINLAGTFADVLATLLTLPTKGQEAQEIRLPRAVDSVVRENGKCDAEVKEVFRSLYDAANGRQVETQVGFIAIAPPVAGFLKDKPYYVATQHEFFLEALTRILAGGSPPREGGTNSAWTHAAIGKLAARLARLVRKRKTLLEKTFEHPGRGENDIIVTAPDHVELNSVISVTGKVSERAKWELRMLENELKRARIVPREEVPSDVITMNTRAEFLDLESGERVEFTLVLPADANINDGKVSVLAPLGTAMLGYRVGDTFEWHVPYGIRRLKVIKVHFQPERSLQQAA